MKHVNSFNIFQLSFAASHIIFNLLNVDSIFLEVEVSNFFWEI